MLRIYRKLILTTLALVPVPGISFAADFAKHSPKEDPQTAEDAFLGAVEAQVLPEKFYLKMEELGFSGVEDLFLPENRDFYVKFVEAYRRQLNGEIILAASSISQLGGGKNIQVR